MLLSNAAGTHRFGAKPRKEHTMSNKPKLSTQEAAAYLGVKPNTLEVWRCKHRGPQYAKLGSRIVYDPEELDAFFAARSISTRDTEADRAGGRK
jgi:transposase-like protein